MEIPFFFNVWVGIAGLFLICSVTLHASSPQGPRSPEEATVLWQEGQAAFNAGKMTEAARLLQRFVDRYPGTEGYLDSHHLLGEALLLLDNPKAAIVPLRYFVEAAGKRPEGKQAKLKLSRAYLAARKYHEALSSVSELLSASLDEEQSENKASSQSTEAEQAPLEAQEVETPAPKYSEQELKTLALALKAEALLNLKHESRAQAALASAREASPSPETRAEVEWVELQLKAQACSKLGVSKSKGPLNEGQAREEIARRGDCVLESTLVFLQVLNTGQKRWAEKAADLLSTSYSEYKNLCANPPLPAGRKRSKVELKKYREELADVLADDCKSKLTRADTILQQWLKKNVGKMTAPVARAREGLAGRT